MEDRPKLCLFSIYTVKKGAARFTAKLHGPENRIRFLKFASRNGSSSDLKKPASIGTMRGSGILARKNTPNKPAAKPAKKRMEYPCNS